MFEQFTDQARRVMVLAQEEARTLNHAYIGTEHLLLGVVREGEGVAARALEFLRISPDGVRGEVEGIIGQGKQSPTGAMPFTPRAKKVLELSQCESAQLGHSNVGTEHILLGLIREGEGVAAQVLVKLGADPSRVRQQVMQLLSETEQNPSGPGDEPTANRQDDPGHVQDSVAGQRTQDELREIRDLLHDVVTRLERIERRLADDGGG